MEEQAIFMFWSQIQFFPDPLTLKFLKMKCNPRNKKLWPKVIIKSNIK